MAEMMKKSDYIVSILLGVLFVVGSCSFLDEEIRSSSQKDSYYQTEEQIVSGINGCYLPLRSIYTTNSFFMVTEAQTDIIYKNSRGSVATLEGVSPVKPSIGSSVWSDGYLGVMRTNAMYAAIERSKLSASEKAPLLAETVVLRAFYYYLLTSFFGDVPYYTEEVTDENNGRITHLGRMSASDTRNACIDELYDWLIVKRALPMAPTYDASNPKEYRVGAAVGLMLAGKMCLWEERWTDCIEFLGYLEDMYGPGAGNPEGALDPYPLSDIPFYNKFTRESIFEISNIYVDYGLRITSTLASVCTPQRTASELDEDAIEDGGSDGGADDGGGGDDGDEGDDGGDGDDSEEETTYGDNSTTDFYNGVGIPWLGGNARTTSPARPCAHFYKTLMPASAPFNDNRRAAYNPADGKAIPDGGGFLAWGWEGWSATDDRSNTPAHWLFFSSTSSSSGRPFLGNKFWCPGMQYTMDSNNLKIFRYAGALLCLAEAWLRKGDEQKCCDYLNAVKSRAGIEIVSPAAFPDREALMEEVRNECARELFGEFNRKFDLVRWGIWFDYINKYSDSSNLKKYAKPCHRYYPIPYQEVTYSGGALDNKEYNQYGL